MEILMQEKCGVLAVSHPACV